MGSGHPTLFTSLTHRYLCSLNHLAHLVSGSEGASSSVDLRRERPRPVNSVLSLGLRCLSQPGEDEMPMFSFSRALSSVCMSSSINVTSSGFSYITIPVRLETVSKRVLGMQRLSTTERKKRNTFSLLYIDKSMSTEC